MNKDRRIEKYPGYEPEFDEFVNYLNREVSSGKKIDMYKLDKRIQGYNNRNDANLTVDRLLADVIQKELFTLAHRLMLITIDHLITERRGECNIDKRDIIQWKIKALQSRYLDLKDKFASQN